MHGSQQAVNGTVADLATVFNPLVDRLPEVEPNENAREAVLLLPRNLQMRGALVE
jgi:hypothetical protein